VTTDTKLDTHGIADVVKTVPGVTALYSAHPTLVTLASRALEKTAATSIVDGPIAATATAIKIRIGIDHTQSTGEIGGAVYLAVQNHLHTANRQLDQTIHIEIASIR